jgi:hypothetical protein
MAGICAKDGADASHHGVGLPSTADIILDGAKLAAAGTSKSHSTFG